MSRAFVREADADTATLPERAVSPHPNFVTPRGLKAIEARVRELETERQDARDGGDEATRARVKRDLRYYSARRASARLVEPAATAERANLRVPVTPQLEGRAPQKFRLVGEAE